MYNHNMNNNNGISKSRKFISFIKYYWINIIIFLTILIILVLTLGSIIYETKTHFQLSKIISILEKEVFIKPSTLLPTIRSIEDKQRISLICNTFIISVDFILFVFLCTLILKRNFISNKVTTHSLSNSYGEYDEGEYLIPNNNNNNGNNSNNNYQFYQNNSYNSNNNNHHNNNMYNSNNNNSNSNNLNSSLFLLSNNMNNHFNNNYERGSIICESPIHEPWNQVTIEKITGSDELPYPKIKTTYYKYGMTAGKIMFDRFSNQLTNDERDEICRLLGIIIYNNNNSNNQSNSNNHNNNNNNNNNNSNNQPNNSNNHTNSISNNNSYYNKNKKQSRY